MNPRKRKNRKYIVQCMYSQMNKAHVCYKAAILKHFYKNIRCLILLWSTKQKGFSESKGCLLKSGTSGFRISLWPCSCLLMYSKSPIFLTYSGFTNVGSIQCNYIYSKTIPNQTLGITDYCVHAFFLIQPIWYIYTYILLDLIN